MELKPLRFPSPGFPRADLRLYPDTAYVFICPVCGATVDVPLGDPSQEGLALTRSQRNAVIDHFTQTRRLPRNEQYVLAGCGACGASFVLAVQYEETSMGAGQVAVVDAAQAGAEPRAA